MKKAMIFVLALISMASLTLSETGGWVKVNIPYLELTPRGSSIQLNPFNPYEIYAAFKSGGSSGWHRSLNLGQSWIRVGGNPDGFFFHPAIPNVVYKVEKISWWQGVLQKSTDGGNTWGSRKSLPGSMPYDYWEDLSPIGPLFIDPVNPGLLFWNADRVYRSADDGTTWNPIDALGKETRDSSGGYLRPKTLIYFDASSPQTVFAVVNPWFFLPDNAHYIFKSTDSGVNWTSVHNWDPVEWGSAYREPRCFSQELPSNMWVSSMWLAPLWSTDNGATWKRTDYNWVSLWAPCPSHRFYYDGVDSNVGIEIFNRIKYKLSQGFPADFSNERYDPWCDFRATQNSNILFLISQNFTDPWQRSLYYIDLNQLNAPFRIAVEGSLVEERSWLLSRTLARIRFSVSGRAEAGIAGESYFLIKKRIKADGIFVENVLEVAGTNLTNDSYTYNDPIDANDLGVQYCVVAAKSAINFLKASPVIVLK